MAAKTNQDVTVYQGEDESIQFTITDSAGAAVDLTGATVTWACNKDGPGSAAALTKTDSAGITIATSVLTVSLSDTDTSGLAAGGYYHEIRAVLSGSGQVMATGTMTVLESGTD